MANEILSKYGTSTAMTITLASLADGTGRSSAQVVDTSPSAPKAVIYFKVTTGTTPTVNTPIKFYFVRADDDGTEHRDGEVGTSNAALSDVDDFERSVQLAHVVTVSADSDEDYVGSFIMDEPGTDWQVAVINNTGAAFNATGSNHYIRYRTVIPEVQ